MPTDIPIKTTLTLKNKRLEIGDTESFYFEPKLDFQAGQYLRYCLEHLSPDEKGTNRFFTISSAPSEQYIMLTTRFFDQSSSFKTALKNLKIGDTIEATGPSGSFTYPDPTQEAVFIAGGIGITPFRSILVDLDSKNLNPPITLLYSNKTAEIVFKQTFDQLAQKHSNLKVIYLISEPDPSWTGEVGHIDQRIIKKYIPDLKKPLFYISGPKPMVESITSLLKELGVEEGQIKQDRFPGYQD